MDKEHIKEMKKRYPKELYNVIEKKGKLVISKKKMQLWVPRKVVKFFGWQDKSVEDVSAHILSLLDYVEFPKDYFEKTQIRVTKECSKKLSDAAKKAGVRKTTYLNAIFRRRADAERHRNN